MMAVLKVLPSSAASTKSLKVENRRALELGGEVRAPADGDAFIWHSPYSHSKVKPDKRSRSKDPQRHIAVMSADDMVSASAAAAAKVAREYELHMASLAPEAVELGKVVNTNVHTFWSYPKEGD